MALSGVSREERVEFVHQLISLLLKDGLEEITETEYEGLNKMMEEYMNSITPVKEDIEETEKQEKPGGGCGGKDKGQVTPQETCC